MLQNQTESIKTDSRKEAALPFWVNILIRNFKDTYTRLVNSIMKETIKEHPLRTIILRFDSSKPFTDFEQAALNSYYAQHDKTWEAKSNLRTHKDTLFDLDIKITELEYKLYAIEQQLDFLEAGLKIAHHPHLPKIEEEFSIHIDEFNTEVLAHSDTLNKLREEIIPEITWYNNWADFIYEHEDWCYDEDSDLIHEVFRRYEEVSIDIISLDDDQQAFFDAHSEVYTLQTEYFKYAQQVFNMFNILQEQAEKAYRRTERVDAYIHKNLKDLGDTF